MLVVGDRKVNLCSEFDEGDFAKHCRGQGSRYNDQSSPAYVEHVDGAHFNFSGCFNGFCCFCALQSGFGSEMFLTNGCFNCVRKEMLRGEFSKLYKLTGASWEEGRWAALPSAVLDNILRILCGDALSVQDSAVVPMEIARE